MKRLFLLIVMISMAGVLSGCFFYSTGETEVGVRTKKFSLIGDKGVEQKAYEAGSTYFFLPFISTLNSIASNTYSTSGCVPLFLKSLKLYS